MVLTSDQELLAVNPGVSLGLLQQADPVVHLLRGVRVAVDHPVGCDDHKRVGPGGTSVSWGQCHVFEKEMPQL